MPSRHFKWVSVVAVVLLTLSTVTLAILLVRERMFPVTTTVLLNERSWTLRSQHFVTGVPLPADRRFSTSESSAGISVLVREGFALGYSERFKVPLWVCMRWDRQMLQRSRSAKEEDRDFSSDVELPAETRGNESYNDGPLDFDRGHMARHLDNAAWGPDNVAFGNRMSNIVPQRASLNRGVWRRLEDYHRNAVAHGSLSELWVVCGAVLGDSQVECLVGNGIAVPRKVFKIVIWHAPDGELQASGFLFSQSEPAVSVERCQVRIASIEEQTGLRFFSALNADEQARLLDGFTAPPWKW